MTAKKNKVNPSKKRYGLSVLAVVLLLGSLTVSLLIRQSEVWAAKREVAELEAQIEFYKAAADALLKQKNLLTTEDYIEKTAREKLGLVMPGELQYMLLD